MPTLHATRSASGAKRWMNCAGSIKAEEGRPNNSSEAARLGTAAHALGEACLLDGSDAHDWLGGKIHLDHSGEAIVRRPTGDETQVPVHATDEGLPEGDWEEFEIDANMADAVQVYLTAVRDELERLGPDAELQVEQRFSLNWLIGFDWDAEEHKRLDANGSLYVSPNGIWMDEDGILWRDYPAKDRRCLGPMFGTNDASVFLLFEHLTVFDYKHGQGIVVEVEDNEQELYYALGKAHEVGWAFETLDLVIVQPRARHSDGVVRRWSTTKDHLRSYEEKLRVAAFATEDPNAPRKAGDWCTFCKAASVCPTLKEKVVETCIDDFSDGDHIEYATKLTDTETTDEDLKLRLDMVPMLNAFIKAVETEALRRLKESPTGTACFGKLVRKRSNRAFREDLTDDITGEPLSVFDKLADLGIPRDLMFNEPKPKSPSQIEAVRPPELMARLKAEGVKAPAKWIKEQIASLTYKPEGGITMAPLDDPRDPVDPSVAAISDFEEVEVDE